jgi:hypothetical protein
LHTLAVAVAPIAAAGVLVGAGSFGRVFAGRLGSQEVAIKVLHHDDATALQVASEVSYTCVRQGCGGGGFENSLLGQVHETMMMLQHSRSLLR